MAMSAGGLAFSSMSPLPAPSESALRRALVRAERGVRLDPTEAETLLHARGLADGEPLDRLLTAAGRVRDAGLASAGRPGVVTYSKKVFIPLTHLCRDRCHYCTFVTTPGQLRAAGKAPFLSPDEVLDIARAGAALGCKEALFTLGDRPEDRWPVAEEWLDAHGFDSTLAYLRAMAIRVLEETGLLPHLNPGRADLGGDPAAQAGVAVDGDDAGDDGDPAVVGEGRPALRLPRQGTGAAAAGARGRRALRRPVHHRRAAGIGEDYAERVEAICAIRASAQRHGHVQEVIVQNFRAKPRTAMAAHDDLDLQEYVAAVAVTRLLLGPKARVQAPPNLTDSTELGLLLRAGVDDWGGVSPLTPDHVNPERPWPHIDDLAALTAEAGFTLRERLAAQPPYVLAPEPWLDPRVRPHVAALAGPDGLAVEERIPAGLPWQEPDEAWTSSGRVDLHVEIDTVGRTADRRWDFDAVYGDWAELRERTTSARDGHSTALAAGDREVLAALLHAEQDPAGLSDAEYLALLGADGTDLETSARSPTRCAPTSTATTSPTSSTGTSTSPTSATPAAGSARSPSGAPTPTPTRCRWSRSATGSTRPGRPARPRSACRAASTPTCPAPPTSTSPAR